jgi:hypothetical protein
MSSLLRIFKSYSITCKVELYKIFIIHNLFEFNEKRNFIVASSAMVLSMLTTAVVFVGSSFAQENITTATNETGAMLGNQTNQTGRNQTQQGPLEQLGDALGGVFGGGNQSQ